MERIPFEIKYKHQIEAGECRVETKDGKPAKIIYWEKKGDFPIVVVVDNGDIDCVYEVTPNGKWATYNNNDDRDIFIVFDDKKEIRTEDTESYRKGYQDGFNAGYESAQNGMTYHTYVPCYAPGGVCMNPYHDCINCPRISSVGKYKTFSIDHTDNKEIEI